MASKDEREFDSGLTGGTDVPALEEDFSLEEILAEYGAGREQRKPAVLQIAQQQIGGEGGQQRGQPRCGKPAEQLKPQPGPADAQPQA